MRNKLCNKMHTEMPSVAKLYYILAFMMCFFAPLSAATENRVTAEWSAALDFQQSPQLGVTLGTVGDTHVFVGGYSAQQQYSSDIWFTDASIDTIQPAALQRAELRLAQGRAYALAARYKDNLVIMGGRGDSGPLQNGVLLKWHKGKLIQEALPDLPEKGRVSSVAVHENTLYVLQHSTIQQSSPSIYKLELSSIETMDSPLVWQTVPMLQGIQKLVQQGQTLYAVVSEPQLSMYELSEHSGLSRWVKLDLGSDLLGSRVIAQALPVGQSHIIVFLSQYSAQSSTEFTSEVLSFNTITQAWAVYPVTGEVPLEQVFATTEGLVAVSKDTSPALYKLELTNAEALFGWQNMLVLVVYLIAMVLVGVYFVYKNKNVNDYFRGGQNIPWWANTCSMYATMLSSLTFVGIPAIVYRTDWLYWVGIWMILAVTPVAVYIAMPFFRKIDATSAYEFLSLRFNMAVRLFASLLFTLFHISRMGIVMALTALALGAVTPFDVWQCVLIIGVLSLIYCTLGGIEAVIWTDTIQTIVLLLGAILCFGYIIAGIDGGLMQLIDVGVENNKFRVADIDFSLDGFTKLSLLVIILGGIGQNLSTYTADQSIVQRYMTTKDIASAKKSIWTNGIMAPIAAAVFFAIGTGLYVFYQVNPERLDPTKQMDQIFPSFISTELPLGIAGLIIAGIFAAAQSTVSTSMNSMATTIVTDFVRPFNVIKSEAAYLRLAKLITLCAGVLGTLVGLLFISPEIRSLMEEYFKVVGMFMGALGGLFILGVVSTRANAIGAGIGLLGGVGLMIYAWLFTPIDGYLFGTIGVLSSVVIGYLASICFPTRNTKNLAGLTIHTVDKK